MQLHVLGICVLDPKKGVISDASGIKLTFSFLGLMQRVDHLGEGVFST